MASLFSPLFPGDSAFFPLLPFFLFPKKCLTATEKKTVFFFFYLVRVIALPTKRKRENETSGNKTTQPRFIRHERKEKKETQLVRRYDDNDSAKQSDNLGRN